MELVVSKLFCVGSAVIALLCDVLSAREVTVVYSAKVTQVPGEIFSALGVEVGMTAAGVLRYETGTANSSPVPQMGWYFPTGIRTFELRVGSIEVFGSERTEFRIENFSADTFRVLDGHSFGTGREMVLNGEKAGPLRLSLAITDPTGEALEGTGLPEDFPMEWPGGGDYPYPHTFALNSGVSAVVMELLSVVEAGDPVVVPLVVESVEVGGERGGYAGLECGGREGVWDRAIE